MLLFLIYLMRFLPWKHKNNMFCNMYIFSYISAPIMILISSVGIVDINSVISTSV